MDKKTITNFERTLEAMAAEIARRAREQDRAAILVESSAEQCEQEVLSTQRDLAVQSLDRNARLLRDVRAAQERIRNGSYGICLECDCEISERRLQAVPQARHCLGCQERMDYQPRSFRLQWAA